MSDREAGNLTYHEAQSSMALLPAYYRWIVGKFSEHITGLTVDLGVGAGYQIAHYKDRAQRVVAVDYSPQLLSWLRERYPDPSVEPRQVDLLGAWEELKPMQADTVLALDVLEHFEDDDAFLGKVAGILRPGGKLCLKVPANASLYSSVDEASGHYRRYDPEALRRKVEAHGFRLLRQEYMNPVGAVLYRWKRGKKKNFSKTFSPRLLRLANLAMPILEQFDHLQILGGLSLVGIYQLEPRQARR